MDTFYPLPHSASQSERDASRLAEATYEQFRAPLSVLRYRFHTELLSYTREKPAGDPETLDAERRRYINALSSIGNAAVTRLSSVHPQLTAIEAVAATYPTVLYYESGARLDSLDFTFTESLPVSKKLKRFVAPLLGRVDSPTETLFETSNLTIPEARIGYAHDQALEFGHVLDLEVESPEEPGIGEAFVGSWDNVSEIGSRAMRNCLSLTFLPLERAATQAAVDRTLSTR